jgi:hypothetical protein
MADQVPGLLVYTDGTFAQWSAPTFSSSDYTASGSMVWTVEQADVNVSYVIIGKTMTVSFRLGATTISGTLSTELMMKIPASKIANRSAVAAIWIAQPGPVFEAGYAEVTGSDSQIKFRRLAENNWISSTNNTYIFGQITFETQ